MRLNETEKKVLIDAIHAHDPSASVWLFGSRVDDQKKGGDIDVAIQSKRIGIMEKIRIKRVVTDALGEQKIDIIVSPDGADPFFRLAMEKGVRIDE